MNDKIVDVIALFKRDGSIIPMRLQLVDEDGMEQAFTIKGYYVSNDYYHNWKKNEDKINLDTVIQYTCKIEVLGIIKSINLLYFTKSGFWKLRM